MACCGEYTCRRRHPVGACLGGLTGQVFAATRMSVVQDHGDGTATFRASEKHDITAQVRRLILDNPGWVRAVLAEAPIAPGG